VKKFLVALLVLALLGGTVASILIFVPISSRSPVSGDPFSDVPEPVIRSYKYADFRGQDVSTFDFTKHGEIFATFTFDSGTRWPSEEKMPSGVAPDMLMEQGKYLGLRLNSLHHAGITGKGIGVAVIDKPVLKDHREYADNMTYVEVKPNDPNSKKPHFHGGAVAGILAGKNGVAPQSHLYYFALPDDLEPYARYAEAMAKLLEVQKALPDGEKIRVVCVPHGIDPEALITNADGARDWALAINEAQAQGILVIYPGMPQLDYTGAGCPPGEDRDNSANYKIWTWTETKKEVVQKLQKANVTSWEAARRELIRLLTEDPQLNLLQAEAIQTFIYLMPMYKDKISFEQWLQDVLEPGQKAVAVPTDYLTVADARAQDTYTYYGAGGLSWGTAYIAGLMALAFQVDPDATPEELFQALLDTATPFHDGLVLVNPRGFIQALK